MFPAIMPGTTGKNHLAGLVLVFCFIEVSTPEVSTFKVSTPEVGTPEVNIPEVGTPEVGTPEVNIPEVNIPEVGIPEVGIPEVSTFKVSTLEVGNPKAVKAKVGTATVNTVSCRVLRPRANGGEVIRSDARGTLSKIRYLFPTGVAPVEFFAVFVIFVHCFLVLV